MADSQVAIVTGGSRGIGRAICVELGKCGYYVVVNYKSNAEAANQTLALLGQAGGEGEVAQFDVTDGSVTRQKLEEIISRFKDIRILINNAGIASDGLMALMSMESWQSVVRTSLDGFYNVTKPVLKQMIRNKRGSIVSISSVSGILGNRGQVNYSAAKAGLIGASKALASEVARINVRVNVVAPGLVETEMIENAPLEQIKQMIPMNRIGRPEEIARVVKFLCSEDASYITGQVIGVNGGMC